MITLKPHTITQGEDFEMRYSIDGISGGTIEASLFGADDKQKDYQAPLKEEDGGIWCLEIDSDISESLDAKDYTLKLFHKKDGKKKVIATGKITIE